MESLHSDVSICARSLSCSSNNVWTVPRNWSTSFSSCGSLMPTFTNVSAKESIDTRAREGVVGVAGRVLVSFMRRVMLSTL